MLYCKEPYYRFAQINRRLSASYKAQTHECLRINGLLIQHLPFLKQRVQKWLNIKIFSHRKGIKLRNHSHKHRLLQYKNQLSRCKKYIEVIEGEDTLINELNQWLPDVKDRIKIVEVGFNYKFEICKIGIVTQVPQSNRYLFLCLGIDGGLKTFYFTPHFKYRPYYKGQVHTISSISEFYDIFNHLSDKF